MDNYINLCPENLDNEHLCCAIADKKHQLGVAAKKEWLRERLAEGHIFRKLDARGKVFIEYAPIEKAWVPVVGEDYIYIYCLWSSGSFKGNGHGKRLLEYCIDDAKSKGKSGVCIISSKKKKPFLSEKKFMQKFGFKTADSIDNDYELLALSFDGSLPCFADSVKNPSPHAESLVIYYSCQCPCIVDCIKQINDYCKTSGVDYKLIAVESLEQAKNLPGVFNNWATFYQGKFHSVHLMNEGYLKKLLGK